MISGIISIYISVVALTSRIRVVSDDSDVLRALSERRPSVYVFWFEHIIFLIHFFAKRNIPLLMTPISRTDALTDAACRLGAKVAKGSLEAGGRHALVTLLDELKASRSVALAADGQRGPIHRPKAGCFMLAQESSHPLVAISVIARFRVRVRTANSGAIFIPLPFNSIEIRLAKPISVAKTATGPEIEVLKQNLAKTIDSIC